MRHELVLIGVAQSQRRRDDAHRLLEPLGRREVVFDARSSRSSARRAAYQTHRRNVERARASSPGERNGIDVLYCPEPAVTVDGAASARRCGSVPATRVSIAQTSSGGSLGANSVVTLIEWSPVGRLRFVNDARRQHRIRDDLQAAAGVDVGGPPVDLDDAAARRWRVHPVAQLKRLLEQDQQARDDLADGVLQCQAEHDRRDAQRGEQSADVRTPDVGEDQRQADRDDDEARDVDEDRRDSLAPRPAGRPETGWRSAPTAANTSSTKPSTVATMRTGVASADTSLAFVSNSSSAASGRM